MQSTTEDNQENNLKWPSIPLLIPILAYLMRKKQYIRLNEIIFKQDASATQKYDGTNVGKDEHGILYGRNLLIPEKTNSYQSTPIKCVRSCNTQLIKNLVLQHAGIDPDDIQKFVIYGELMCNKGLYNYTQDKLASTHQVFGGVIKPNSDHIKVADKLALAKFAFMIRSIDDKDEEDQQEEQAGGNQNKIIMLLMNQTLAEIIGNNVQIVPSAGKYQNLYELINSNYEWMLNGMGEGLVIISPTSAYTQVRKWKNGSEASATNQNNLNLILQTIEEDKQFEIFGNQTTQAKELFQKMLEVEISKLINGSIPQIVQKVQPQLKLGLFASLSEPEREQYLQVIRSAKTKFDHCDVYFQKNIKGLEEYSLLISKECLNDIKIDNKDKQQLDRHLAIVKEIIKEDFVTYKKSSSIKK